LIEVRDLEHAIALANASEFGLSASVCTQRLDLALRAVRGLECGSVHIQDVPGYRSEAAPFGGIKHSGLGLKEGVAKTIEAYTHQKTFSLPWPI
jgi:aldehyde dehydrogenase (NAD+)